MHYLGWFIKFVVFVILFGFAMHNATPIDLFFFLGYKWNAPLAMILLVFFVLGAAFALLATLGQVFKLRRQLSQAKKEITALTKVVPTNDDLLVVEPPKDAI